jgi:hypothetical protein
MSPSLFRKPKVRALGCEGVRVRHIVEIESVSYFLTF